MTIRGIYKEDLHRMYVDERLSQQEIADYYDVNKKTVLNRMREYGIKARSLSEAIRQYAINEDFFKEWTKESAWVFGWFIGDGYYMTGDEGIAFRLTQKDKEVLYKFKDVMESEHLIYDRVTFNRRYSKAYKLSCLQISSVEMAKALRSLCYEDIPEWHRNHGIRGFWEAEGSVWLIVDKRKKQNSEHIGINVAQKDPAILEWIWNVLKDEGVVEGGSLNQNKRNGVWVLHFGEADSVALYHYLYDDCGNLYLPRKMSRFEELMARRGYI